MNDEILTINDYPIGWGWLKDVPLQDWEWILDVFATMTDNTDDLILNAYPKEETEEEPFISFTLENIKYKLYID